MAAKFYSLEEVAAKLNKTTDEVKEIARQGKLRVFYEGPKPLYKAEEVEALMSDTSIMPSKEIPAPAEQKPQEDEILSIPEPTEVPAPTETPAPPIELPEVIETPELSETPEPIEISPTETPLPTETPEPVETVEPTEAIEPTEVPEPTDTSLLSDSLGLIEVPEPAETPAPAETPMPDDSLGLIETPEPAEAAMPDDSLELIEPPGQTGTPQLSDTPEPAELSGLGDTPEAGELSGLGDTPEPGELSGLGDTPEPGELSDLSKTPVEESDMSAADTAIAGSGIDVLDETGSRAESTDDTVIEAKDTTTETSLQEIEEDVNLDSFGSGSGLLDLSLQADDTSLGGILDEIYAPEADEDHPPAEPGSAVEVAAEAEQMMPTEDFAAAEEVSAIPVMAPVYAEPEPDTVSNTLGILLFLPLLAILYTAIVTTTGFSNIMLPSIFEKVQGLIWYIAGGAVVVSLVIVGAAFMLGGEKSDKPTKAKKAKKEKPPKAKKAKKPKKPKKAKKGKEAPPAE